jgi:SAM-dependent methyltransferase
MKDAIVAQFKKPTGALGALAGMMMAARGSNRARNVWTLELLALAPTDRVLEIGFGPGWALARAAALVPDGRVVGVDHSEVMVRQAARRNRDAIAAGRVELRLGGFERLDDAPGSFDAVYSANAVQFWPEPAARFAELHRLLAPGGRIATTFQPRTGDVSSRGAHAMAERIEGLMAAAGFARIERRELPLSGAPAVCVLGVARGAS